MLQGVYFYLLSLAVFLLLAAGSQVSSVLWLAIICTTWSRKRVHVVCIRGSKMCMPPHAPPASRFGGARAPHPSHFRRLCLTYVCGFPRTRVTVDNRSTTAEPCSPTYSDVSLRGICQFLGMFIERPQLYVGLYLVSTAYLKTGNN